MKPARPKTPSPNDLGAGTRQLNPVHVRLALATLAVTAVVLVTYWPALSTKAIWLDDLEYLTGNDVISQPSIPSAARAFTEVAHPSIRGYYQPLTMVSLMIDVAAGGTPANPRAFHVTSLGLHLANTALLIVLLYALFGRPAPAVLAGLLFGVHPITVEPVVWIVERKALLAAFFSLAALIAYASYAKREKSLPYYAALGLYGLALLAKPTATPLPVLMLLLDAWPLGRLSWRSVREKIPFFAVALASGVITMISQGRTAVLETPAGNSAAAIPLEMARRLAIHFVNFVWPVYIAPYYAAPQPASLANPVVLASVLGVLVVAAAVLAASRWSKAPLVAALFFTLALVPTIGLFRYTPMFTLTNYAYLPVSGFLLLVTAGLVWALPSLACTRSASALVAAGLILALAAGEIVQTRKQIHHWDSTLSLAGHAVQMAPNASMPHRALGDALAELGQRDRAMAAYETAVALNPAGYQARVNLGKVLIESGRAKEAIPQLEEALRLRPRLPDTLLNLGVALAQTGRTDEAAARFREAMEVNARDPRAYYNLGHLLELQGKHAEARAEYAAAAKLAPHYYAARLGLGNMLAAAGDLPGAAREYKAAAALNPRDPELQNNLGAILSQLGRDTEAVAHLQMALRLNPAFTAARDNLAKVQEKMGKK